MSTMPIQANLSAPSEITPDHRSVASYERELAQHRVTENRLRQALAADEALLREKNAQLQQQAVLGQESDHRLLNGLQLIASLLALQSRSSANAETTAQLKVAGDRIATIERVHRRLHCLDNVQSVAFKSYLEDFCRDFCAMLSKDAEGERSIAVEGSEINLPTHIAVPLSFVVNELVTNAAKYGTGLITVRLEEGAGPGRALSVSNDGPSLPDGFDPAACQSLGMKIVRSFVDRIGGELRVGRNADNRGARFTVLFS